MNDSIVSEAKSLAKQGIQEIILVSQITTNYGQDIWETLISQTFEWTFHGFNSLDNDPLCFSNW